jgi:hypothetical protein
LYRNARTLDKGKIADSGQVDPVSGSSAIQVRYLSQRRLTGLEGGALVLGHGRFLLARIGEG